MSEITQDMGEDFSEDLDPSANTTQDEGQEPG
jgi:hypothetical protein